MRNLPYSFVLGGSKIYAALLEIGRLSFQL